VRQKMLYLFVDILNMSTVRKMHRYTILLISGQDQYKYSEFVSPREISNFKVLLSSERPIFVVTQKLLDEGIYQVSPLYDVAEQVDRFVKSVNGKITYQTKHLPINKPEQFSCINGTLIIRRESEKQ